MCLCVFRWNLCNAMSCPVWFCIFNFHNVFRPSGLSKFTIHMSAPALSLYLFIQLYKSYVFCTLTPIKWFSIFWMSSLGLFFWLVASVNRSLLNSVCVWWVNLIALKQPGDWLIKEVKRRCNLQVVEKLHHSSVFRQTQDMDIKAAVLMFLQWPSCLAQIM